MVERELEREGRPEAFGGPGEVEMGTTDDLLLPLALSAGALAAGSSSPKILCFRFSGTNFLNVRNTKPIRGNREIPRRLK